MINTKVLIIDEISMISGDLFDRFEEIARIVRKDSGPFGGIQLIICGDFLQCKPYIYLIIIIDTPHYLS